MIDWLVKIALIWHLFKQIVSAVTILGAIILVLYLASKDKTP